MLIPHEIPALGYKCQLAKRFDRAAKSYDAYAEFQNIVLDRLLTMLPINRADVVLDLGTGTGQALAALTETLKPQSCIGLDLSSQMLAVAKARCSDLQNTHYVCADGEQLPFREASFDLVFSSLAIQWCLAPNELFNALYRVTKPGGYAIFSTLSHGSMPEIANAWLGVDHSPHTHQYMTAGALLSCLKASQWQLSSFQLSNIVMWFESPERAIDSLKKVGASLIAAEGRSAISPSKWKAFLAEYNQQRGELGVPLSYQVSFVVVQKPFYPQE
ncbi:malonyl-ACP O-methyltransferase BioC [Marinomonas sp. M1K-6]|uniref:Malonyl-[acyl-carrier protein] O-methyltransferase n=1 Tax=Marinomonas profundi TaxID=2726122 RepID=A0A847R3J7_9GAMM|nr:malonyl-ACP O-methyltransferase BioC [Marinomonas profundi]NLQ16526.1 malonyl-ACP O-methyltransferase BioC [Marinomonas profundi]UDV03885.1 malonyl-ACP O-methyltransferase BioC [Marinomonas profundi]